jgi:alpha-1,3-rhamnosyltransferase
MASAPAQPLVSMVIPSFNHGTFVQTCIESVLTQDYDNIELIIIDDGSADNSVGMIRALVSACEARFTRFEFRARPNKGLAATINEAIEWSTGKYFAAIASDDVLLKHKTSTLVRYLECRSEIPGVFSSCYPIDSTGRRIGVVKPLAESCSFSDLICRNQTPIAPTQLLRLEGIKQVGGYKPELIIEDLYMWLALTESGARLGFVDDVLVEYRQHGGNSYSNPLQRHEPRIRVFEYFSTNRLYKKALAINSLVTAGYCASSSKPLALKYLYNGFVHHKGIVVHPMFFKTALKILMPKIVIGAIHRS